MKLVTEVEQKMRGVRRQYNKRKKQAESCVSKWHWATNSTWNMNPLYFDMHSIRPGRRLKKEPAATKGNVQYGVDENGRTVVERKFREFGCAETFCDWSISPVEVVCYDQKTPVNMILAKFVRDRLSLVVRTALGGVAWEKYQWNGEVVESIEIRFADRYEDESLDKLAPYQTIRAKHAADGSLVRLAIEWMPTEEEPGVQTEVILNRAAKPVEIDLRKDESEIANLIRSAVSLYAKKHSSTRTAKKHPPAARIDLNFSLGDSTSTPWVHINIDTKPGSEPDGDPTHPDFAKLKRSKWLPAVKTVCQGEKVSVLMPNGKKRKCDSRQFANVIGKLLVSVLLELRKSNLFDELPKSDRCELGVEDPTTGEFGWPAYEDRGKKNLA
jgi:hypothetical protein